MKAKQHVYNRAYYFPKCTSYPHKPHHLSFLWINIIYFNICVCLFVFISLSSTRTLTILYSLSLKCCVLYVFFYIFFVLICCIIDNDIAWCDYWSWELLRGVRSMNYRSCEHSGWLLHNMTPDWVSWVSPGASLCVAGFNELFCLLSCFLFVHGRCEKLHPGDKCGAQFKWFGHVTCGGPLRYMTFSCELSRDKSRCIVFPPSRLSP